MYVKCAITLPISHFKVVYYFSVTKLGIASLMMSHDQSFKMYMIRMWKKLSSSQFIVAETITLFTPNYISIRNNIVSRTIYIFHALYYHFLIIIDIEYKYKHQFSG